MIDPLRYRSLQEQLEFDEDDTPLQCWQCLRDKVNTPAFFLCHECGKVGDSRPFCEPCFFEYHLSTRKGKDKHKPHPIVQGDPVIVQTLADGDGTTFAKIYDWVTLDYTLTTDKSDIAIEDTFLTKQPLTFQSGCSGPCIHLQLFGCTEIAAADIMGASDPYCAVYWKNDFVGATSTKHMTLNPKWANQTFVLPLAAEFMAALSGDDRSSVLFNAGALLPKLRIELYDWDRLSKNDFLGQASVSDAEILGILRRVISGETDEDHAISFDLKPKQSRGQLGVRVALRGSKLYVHVMQAENVPKADPFSLSDPYCEVYWNDKKIGKTARIDGTLDPVWDLEIFLVKIDQEGPNSIDQSTLKIVCLDWDQFGSDDVLGQIELTGWQIKQLAESKDGDEVISTDEGAMGEADMEKVFDFIRMLQEHEMDPAGLGKMTVGVPQDPDIAKHQQQEDQEQHIDEEDQEVESRKKKKRKKKRKNGRGEGEGATQRGTDRGEGETAEKEAMTKLQPQENGNTGLNAAPSSSQDGQQMVGEDNGQEAGGEIDPAGENKAGAGAVLVEGTDPEDHMGVVGCQGEGYQQVAGAVDAAGRPCGQGRLSEVGLESRQGEENEEFGNVLASGEEHKPAPHDDGEISVTILKTGPLATEADQLATEKAGGMAGSGQSLSSKILPDGENVLAFNCSSNGEEQLVQQAVAATPENDAPGAQRGADVEEGGAQGEATAGASHNLLDADMNEANAGGMEEGQPLSVELPPERKMSLESGPPNRGGQTAPNGGPKTMSNETPDADVEEGGGVQVKNRRKAKIRNSVEFRYRDASVERFEEDRGVLLEYLDDGSSVWVETKSIPRLQIRLEAPIKRNVLQRVWDQRHKLFNLHKRVLNVKRGMKMILGVAMTGSRMQWYQLELTDEQSGANFVRGTVDCRFLHHTRGSVLRGLDVAVSHMSLGERARVEVRSDYGFGEVYASRDVPPYATLVFVAQVAAIRNCSAKWLVIRRGLKDKADDALFRLRSHVSIAVSSYHAVKRAAGLMIGSMRKNKKEEEKNMIPGDDDGGGWEGGEEDEEGSLRRDSGAAVPEEGGGVVPEKADLETELLL